MARCGGKRDLETELFHIGLTVLAAGTTAWVLSGFLPPIRLPEIPCFFSSVLGFYCPGCGGTRAVYALLQGQFVRSLVLHPIVPYTAVIGGWFMFSQTVERLSRGRLKIALHFRDVYLWTALGLILLNVLVKNLALILWGVDLLQ